MEIREEKEPVHFIIAVQKLFLQCKRTGLLHLPTTKSKRRANDLYKAWLIKQDGN